MFDVPEGYELLLKGRADQWTARLIPEGYKNRWSPIQPVQAKATDPMMAIAFAKAKIVSTIRSSPE